MIADIIVVIILLFAVVGALFYIYRAKKKGRKCIGCPYSEQCGKKSCSDNKKDLH